jgi:hypothetical protein
MTQRLPPVLHVGFAHCGTTSLQQNIFLRKPETVFYAGVPYDELGGIFSYIKYHDPDAFNRAATWELCQRLIFARMTPGQRLVMSDESIVDQPAIYYTPSMMPNRIIAERLFDLFGPCVVLFTLRNQYDSVRSNYNVLKTNALAFNQRTLEPFDEWFAGNLTQVRNLFLRNLDPSQAINVYQSVFGQQNVHVLPLEILTHEGTAAYLDRLAQMTGIEITPADTMGYIQHNASRSSEIILTEEQRAIIRDRSSNGNQFVADTFHLPLREFGYPMPEEAPPETVAEHNMGKDPIASLDQND